MVEVVGVILYGGIAVLFLLGIGAVVIFRR
jgi:hypothetical protein